MADARQRIVFAVLVTVVGLAMFVVASAYVIDHAYSRWLAGAVGLFAFPLTPAAWHLWAERKRTRLRAADKTPAKASLTGFDRFWLRLAAIALLVIGPMIAVSRFAVPTAVWHHGLWFLPDHSSAESNLTPASISRGGPIMSMPERPAT